MREATLRQVLVVRACEEADVHGAELPRSLREAAGREAVDAAPEDPAAQIAGRAARLYAVLVEQHARLASLAGTAWFVPSAWLVAAVAFAAGLLADTLGRDRALSLLAFPVLGLLAWNAGVLVAWLLARLRGAAPAARLATWGGVWSALRARLFGEGFAARAASGFAALWLARAGGLEAARWRARLHVGALAFALGVVASLYLAGFAFAYEATWESTFLGAGEVRRLLGVVLGPAAWLLGSPLPDVAGIEALRAPASGPAAPWIHRFALTALLAVAVPRAALALGALADVRARGAALAPDLSAPYYARVLALGRGAGQHVAILPYSTELSAKARARLLELAHDLFGNRALVDVAPGVTYGEDPGPTDAGAAVLAFGLAQSPEREVHGRFAAELAQRLAASGGSLLVVLDAERYAAVVDADRVAERRRAWDRVLDEVGLSATLLEPDADTDALFEAASRALRAPVAAA